MNNIKIKSLFYLLISLMVVNCRPGIERKIDKLFINYNSENGPGASLIVIKDSVVVLTKSYGASNVEQGILVKNNTNFRLASFTKQFTAMCIAQLEEQCYV